MNRRLAIGLSATVLCSVVFAEILLRPTSGHERWQLVLILVAPVLVTAALVPFLGRWVSTRTSVAGTALIVGLCSLALGAVTTSAASNAMFVSSHDYRLFLVVLLLSSGIALVVGSHLARPLAVDIARVGRVAEQVAAGDLSARTGVQRTDEVGRTARAVDSMVVALDDAAAQRARVASARQLMFTSIGHDLRTPLAAMRAAVESLQDGVAPDPARYLDILGTHLDNIEALLDQLVEYARIESGHSVAERSKISLTELAHETVEALTPLADRFEVALSLDPDGPAYVVASATEMSRLLRNLLDNAIRHSPRGGQVTVTVRSEDDVEVRVVDSGSGFHPAFVDSAFEPFTRADPARDVRTGHSGLGLAIARAVVESHGGRIWVNAAPFGDVRFCLPVKEQR